MTRRSLSSDGRRGGAERRAAWPTGPLRAPVSRPPPVPAAGRVTARGATRVGAASQSIAPRGPAAGGGWLADRPSPVQWRQLTDIHYLSPWGLRETLCRCCRRVCGGWPPVPTDAYISPVTVCWRTERGPRTTGVHSGPTSAPGPAARRLWL